MDKESSSFDLNPKKLARLWSIGSDANLEQGLHRINNDEKRAELLRDCLATSLPMDQETLDLLPRIFKGICRDLRPFTGESIGSLVIDPQTDFIVIERIKNWAKEFGSSTEDETEREVALAIYYTSIASALVFHEVKLSQYDYQKLKQAFGTLSRQEWIPSILLKILKRAYKYAEKNAGTKVKE